MHVVLGVLFYVAFVCPLPKQTKRDGYLDVGGVKIHYSEAGTGEPVVLLHDGRLDSSTWNMVWDSLASKFRVVSYDRRGFGLSDPPKAPFLQAADLDQLLKYSQIERATLVGSSSGGGVALDFAVTHPQQVQRLILIGSVLHGMLVTNQMQDRGARNQAPLEKGDVEGTIQNWAHDPYLLAPGDEKARKILIADLRKHPEGLRYTGDFEYRLKRPARLRLGDVNVPTLILVGEHDIPDVQSFGGVIQAGILGSRREIIPGAGHLIQLEKPLLLSRRIAKFVGDYPGYTPSTAALETCVGKYDLFGGTQITSSGKNLVIHMDAEADIPLFPIGPDRFRSFFFTQDGVVTFLRHADGQVYAMDLRTEDNALQKVRKL